MCEPKLIEEITLDDLRSHRWCFYQNDDGNFDAFDYVIPDTHPEFSHDVIELELAEFKFTNGKLAYGIYDGSESFNIVTNDQWYSFWYGIAEPEQTEVKRMSAFFSKNGFQLPVEATAKWSKTTKKYNGINYINNEGETIEVSI